MNTTVTFVQGRQEGEVVARYQGKIAFPERDGIHPHAGEEWEVVSASLNAKGTVYFLRLGKRVEQVSLICYLYDGDNGKVRFAAMRGWKCNTLFADVCPSDDQPDRSGLVIGTVPSERDGLYRIAIQQSPRKNIGRILECVLSGQEKKAREEQFHRSQQWGYSDEEVEEVIASVSRSHGVAPSDVTGGWGIERYRGICATRDAFLAALERDAAKSAESIASAPAVMKRTQSTSRHTEAWCAGGQEVGVLPCTPKEVIVAWFVDRGITEEPQHGWYERADATAYGHYID